MQRFALIVPSNLAVGEILLSREPGGNLNTQRIIAAPDGTLPLIRPEFTLTATALFAIRLTDSDAPRVGDSPIITGG
jgi:hypothetical protein